MIVETYSKGKQGIDGVYYRIPSLGSLTPGGTVFSYCPIDHWEVLRGGTSGHIGNSKKAWIKLL